MFLTLLRIEFGQEILDFFCRGFRTTLFDRSHVITVIYMDLFFFLACWILDIQNDILNVN